MNPPKKTPAVVSANSISISCGAPFAVLALWLWLLAFVAPASATVTNVAYWRLGENDPGAANGGTAASTTNQLGGTMTLGNSPRYTNDIATTAATIGSTLALRFNGTNYGTNTLFSFTNN